MRIIDEEGRRQYVTPDEGGYLVVIQLVEECSACGCYHHREFERWDEIDEALKEFAAIKQAYVDP